MLSGNDENRHLYCREKGDIIESKSGQKVGAILEDYNCKFVALFYLNNEQIESQRSAFQ